jgi:hypothetical protein
VLGELSVKLGNSLWNTTYFDGGSMTLAISWTTVEMDRWLMRGLLLIGVSLLITLLAQVTGDVLQSGGDHSAAAVFTGVVRFSWRVTQGLVIAQVVGLTLRRTEVRPVTSGSSSSRV